MGNVPLPLVLGWAPFSSDSLRVNVDYLSFPKILPQPMFRQNSFRGILPSYPLGSFSVFSCTVLQIAPPQVRRGALPCFSLLPQNYFLSLPARSVAASWTVSDRTT